MESSLDSSIRIPTPVQSTGILEISKETREQIKRFSRREAQTVATHPAAIAFCIGRISFVFELPSTNISTRSQS